MFAWFVTFVTENAATPYSARVIIEDMQYGVGYASSKKAAKLEAGVFYYWSGLRSQVGSKQVRYIKGQGYRAKLEANKCVILKVRATEPSWKQVCCIKGQGYSAKLEAGVLY